MIKEHNLFHVYIANCSRGINQVRQIKNEMESSRECAVAKYNPEIKAVGQYFENYYKQMYFII